ncbi:MAG TPA: hypothetical protein VM509_11220, partial [Planctomycetota bacterium]|nr:hypothetical protein [Planctomycetota bacterium]
IPSTVQAVLAARIDRLSAEDKALLQAKLCFYVVEVENKGGLVAPIVVETLLEDGTCEETRVAAEVWRKGAKKVSKLILTTQPALAFELDPHLETADVDLSNNSWPPKIGETRVKLEAGAARGGRGGRGGGGGSNPMREAAEREKQKAEVEAKAATPESKPVEAGAPAATKGN